MIHPVREYKIKEKNNKLILFISIALDGSITQDPGLSLSLSQIARKANHRHRRSSK
jgi:hypothetical protein